MAVLLSAVCAAGHTQTKLPQVTGETVEYRDGNTVLQGYVAHDSSKSGKRPVVLVVHDWDGLGEYERMRADKLAGLGYLAFAVDVYGKGIRPKTVQEAGAESTKWSQDTAGLRRRERVALDFMRQHKLADSGRVAAIGYCFGGKAVLELARSGADVRGVVSFHGTLATPNAADAKHIKGKVLVLHGAADPFVPSEQLKVFDQEMRSARVSYKIVKYPGAVHAFTVSDASKWGLAGAKYDAAADRKSWEEMRRFLKDVLR